MLNNKSTRSARLFWLGALLGAAVFLLVYGLAPLDAANDAFSRGGYIEKDIQQHYAGWLFYRSSAPGWPLGVTQAVNAPQGVSVAYTDSIPLLAIVVVSLASATGIVLLTVKQKNALKKTSDEEDADESADR